MATFRRILRTLDWSLGVGATSWERLIVAIVALMGITFLGAQGIVDAQAVAGIYSVVIGYMLGHGAGAAAERRERSDKDRDARDRDGGNT